MVEELTGRLSSLRSEFRRRAINGTVNWAHRSPRFREWVLGRLSHSLGQSYEQTVRDNDLLKLHLWFGKSLLPFARRLVAERPRAAKAVIRLGYQWANDVMRRTQKQLMGVTTPCTVVIEPTSRCNLNCPGCYSKSTRQGHDMSYELLQATVRECAEMGTTLITLSGGEPFLREKEDQAITRLARTFPDLGFLVYTNSLCIDEAIAERIGEAGNVFPAISVEGTARLSDARRGAGYYKNALTVRHMLAKNEVMYGCSVTATRKNAEYVVSEDFIDLRIEEGDMFAWYFLVQPIGRSPRTDLMITADQRAHMREQLYRFRSEGKPIFIGDFWNDGQFVEGCLAGGQYYFHIYAHGDISPCVFAPVACGNMADILSRKGEYKSLTDFVERHPFFVGFREKQREVSDHRAPCMLIDHPEKFRELCAKHPWYAAINMPEGYLDGQIAADVAQTAQEWQEKLMEMPVIPDSVRHSAIWQEIERPPHRRVA